MTYTFETPWENVSMKKFNIQSNKHQFSCAFGTTVNHKMRFPFPHLILPKPVIFPSSHWPSYRIQCESNGHVPPGHIIIPSLQRYNQVLSDNDKEGLNKTPRRKQTSQIYDKKILNPNDTNDILPRFL